jgi:hypothetical protein
MKDANYALNSKFMKNNMNNEPLVLTLSDDEIEIQFPETWIAGKQFNWLRPLFVSWVRIDDYTIRVRF